MYKKRNKRKLQTSIATKRISSLTQLKRCVPQGFNTVIYADNVCMWYGTHSRRTPQKRLEEALFSISTYLFARALHLLHEKSLAMAFTKKRMDRCPVMLSSRALSYARTNKYLGVIIDRNFYWSHEKKRLCARISATSQVLRNLSGLRWASNCSSMLELHEAYFDGFISYSLLLLHHAASTNKTKLEAK